MRFALVGLVSTATYFGLTIGLVYAGLPLQIAHILGYLVSIVVSYLGQKMFTFGIRGEHRRSGGRFLVAMATIAFVQYTLILVLQYLRCDPRLIVAVSTLYYPLASFCAHSLWTFRPPPAADPQTDDCAA